MWRKPTRPIPVIPDHAPAAAPVPGALEPDWIPDPLLLPDAIELPDPIELPDLVDTRPPSGAPPPPTGAPAADQRSDLVGASCRVLLVDERQERRALMRMVVETGPAGTSVVAEAGTVAAALDALARHHPNVAVVEIGRPVRTGLAVITALRAGHPSLLIVVCSFQGDPPTQLAATLAGANVYLTKPVSPEDLLFACRPPMTVSPQAQVETHYDPGRLMAPIDDAVAVASTSISAVS